MNEDIYNDIRKRIQKKYDARKEILTHLVAYSFVMFFLWVVIFSPMDLTSGNQFGHIIAKLLTGAWTLGILVHLTQFMLDEQRERAIDRELAQYMPNAGKLKNEDAFYRLSDDGEILADDYEDDSSEGRRQERI